VLSRLCSLLGHRKFSSLNKFPCPTFNVTDYILFPSLTLNLTSSLIDFFLGGNIRDRTAKQMVDQFRSFDLLHYEKYVTYILLCVFVQRLVPYFHKFDDGKCCTFFANVTQ
jgi:hypothetical protein